MLYHLFTYSVVFILLSLNSIASPIPLSFQKKQTQLPQLWDIKHDIFSQKDKIGNWRQRLKFNAKTKIFTLNNYSNRGKNLGAQKIEEFLIAKSNANLEPLSYSYILKINNKIVKTIDAQFYKKWKTAVLPTVLPTVLKAQKNRSIKKRKVANFKNTNQLWVKGTKWVNNAKGVRGTKNINSTLVANKAYKAYKTNKISFNKQLPASIFLSSFLSLVLSQKMANHLDQKNFNKKNYNLKTNSILQKRLSFISFSEETFTIEAGTAKLTSKNNEQLTWQSQYKNYSFDTTMDKKGKLIKTSMPLRQLRSQIIAL